MKKIVFIFPILLSMSVLISGCATTKRKPMFPEGKEYITLLSASISPEVITMKGSEVIINYKTNMPLEEEKEKLLLVRVIPARGVTTTITSEYPTFAMSSDQVKFEISNPEARDPKLPVGTGKGQFNGSGAIYFYLKTEKERVSNILSVLSFFEP
jgi:hypothetical protein